MEKVRQYAPITENSKKVFLDHLRKVPNVTAASAAAGHSRNAMRHARRKDPAFAEAWDEAKNEALDNLEGRVYEGATTGVEEPVFYQGKQVGTKHVVSERWAEFFLTAHRPKKYAKNRLELTGKDGSPLIPETNTIELARRVAFLLSQAVKPATIVDVESKALPAPEEVR